MKKTRIFNLVIAIAIVGPLMFSCGGNGGNNNKNSSTETNVSCAISDTTPLNLSIYLDLSDRLVRDNVSQISRDTADVAYFAKYLFNRAHRLFHLTGSEDKARIFFYPAPNDPFFDNLSDSLSMDLSSTMPAQKKPLLKALQSKWMNALGIIYDTTIKSKNWVGSDIWGFFKDKVKDQCICENHRNILVIITDGYIYAKDNKIQKGHEYSYIVPSTLTDKKSSLIASRTDLKDLEVLFLEVNPKDPKSFDQMNSIISGWLIKMGVKHFKICPTGTPPEVQTCIDDFMKCKPNN